MARKESEDRSRRVRRKHLELAEQGRPGGQLGWGIRSEAEREMVREAAQRVLDGQGLMRIAREWNERGGPAQGRLQSLDDDYYLRGSLSQGRYRSIRTRLEREIGRLHVLVDAATKRRVVLQPDPRALWADGDIGQRRELVRMIVERVTIRPARPGVGRFDPLRVQVDIPSLNPMS